VKRFLKTFAFLMVSLFLVASGVDAALDHLTHAVTQSSFTAYNEQGSAVLAYDGDLSACKAYGKAGAFVTPSFLHRT
jgi:hypothetical protein